MGNPIGLPCGTEEVISIAIEIAGFFPATAVPSAVISVVISAIKLLAEPENFKKQGSFGRAVAGAIGASSDEIVRRTGEEILEVAAKRFGRIGGFTDILVNAHAFTTECLLEYL